MSARRSFLSHWRNWLGLLLVAGFVFVAFAAPLLSPQDPENPGTTKIVGRFTDIRPHPPSPEAPLGTLPGQLSVYHTLVWGTRSALSFGLAVAVGTAIIGTLIGATSAYFGGWFNDLMMRITDAFLAFPAIAGVVLIQQMLTIWLFNAGAYYSMGGVGGVFYITSSGTIMTPEDLPFWLVWLQQLNPVMIAFVLFSWMPYARMMNTVVLRLKQVDYIHAARALGSGHGRIIFRHLIPNAIAPVLVLAARDVGGMVLLQATFTFIGLGGDSPWGALLSGGRNWVIGPGGSVLTYWWIFLPATLALVLFGTAWNLIGDGLNEVLNPRTR